jgi:hypothetical protein
VTRAIAGLYVNDAIGADTYNHNSLRRALSAGSYSLRIEQPERISVQAPPYAVSAL